MQHVCTYVYVCLYVPLSVFTWKCICLPLPSGISVSHCLLACTFGLMNIVLYLVCVCVCVCVYVCMCLCVCLCVYVYVFVGVFHSVIPTCLFFVGPMQRCTGYGTLQVPEGHDYKQKVTYQVASILCQQSGGANLDLPHDSLAAEGCMKQFRDRMKLQLFGNTVSDDVWWAENRTVAGTRHVVCFVGKYYCGGNLKPISTTIKLKIP